jgi:cell division topological specificity factor
MEFLMRIPFFHRFLGGARPREDSREAAKDRLRNALVGDRSTVAPGLIQSLEGEMLSMLGRYMDVDRSGLKLCLADRDGGMRLTASAPILRIHRQASLPPEALQESRPASAISTALRIPRKKTRGPRVRRSFEEE